MVATFPEPFGTLDDLDASVRFDFDERISERAGGGSLDDAIQISPRVGELSVRKGRSSLEVRPEGGFRSGIVYRITLQPVVTDLFGNQLADPFELVFSTGGEPSPTTLAGEVWDRITGRGFAEASVQAVGPDSLVHVASASREGIYAFRYLPGGTFRVSAFEDQDRDGQVDSAEVQGVAVATLGLGDTLLLDVAVLAPDTLPAVLVSADALDSVTVALELDDYLDPEAPLDVLEVELELEGAAAPAVARVLSEADYTAFVEAVVDSLARVDSIARAEAEALAAAREDSVRAEADSAAAAARAAGDTAAAAAALAAADSAAAALAATDSAAALAAADSAAPVDSARATPVGTVARARGPVRLEPLPGARPGPLEGTQRVLPGRRIVVLLGAPLQVEVEYTVRVAGAVNINGLGGGGGEATLTLAAPPADTVVGGDTLTVTDTARVDTVAVSTASRGPEPGVADPHGCRLAGSLRESARAAPPGAAEPRPAAPGPGASACAPGAAEAARRARHGLRTSRHGR